MRALVLLPLALVPSMAITMWVEFKGFLVSKKFRHPQRMAVAHVENGRAESGRGTARQLLEKIRECLLHAGRIFDPNPLNFQSQDGEAHGDAMIVVCLYFRAVQRAVAGKDRQILILLDDV